MDNENKPLLLVEAQAGADIRPSQALAEALIEQLLSSIEEARSMLAAASS